MKGFNMFYYKCGNILEEDANFCPKYCNKVKQKPFANRSNSTPVSFKRSRFVERLSSGATKRSTCGGLINKIVLRSKPNWRCL